MNLGWTGGGLHGSCLHDENRWQRTCHAAAYQQRRALMMWAMLATYDSAWINPIVNLLHRGLAGDLGANLITQPIRTSPQVPILESEMST